MKILYLLLLLIALNIGCVKNKNAPKEEIGDIILDQMPDQISYGVEVFFIDSSFTKAILTADTARVFQDRSETLLNGNVIVEFMSRTTGKRVSVLTANQARIDDKTKDMLAKGNVIVVSDSSIRKLETSILEWNHKTQKLFSTEFVKITSPDEQINGYGFESDQNLTNYKIFKVSGSQKQK